MPSLDHVAVRVSDVDAAISFYTDKLGLKLLFREFDETHHEAFCFLQLAGAKLELLQSLDDQNRPQPFAPPPVHGPATTTQWRCSTSRRRHRVPPTGTASAPTSTPR